MRRSPLLALLVAAFLLPACSSEEQGVAADERSVTIDEAVDATVGADSLSVVLEGHVTGSPIRTERFRLEGALSRDGEQLDVDADADGQQVEMRVDGEQSWIRSDDLSSGADWVAVPTEDLKASELWAGIDLDFLYLLKGAVDADDGTEVDDGLVRYRFEVDLERAAERAPSGRRQAVEGVLDFEGAVEPEVTGVVLIDRDGYVRSLRIVGVQDSFEVELEVEVDDIGEPVEVEHPDADDVVDVANDPALAEELGLR